ncbi:unnamed protein product [Penicillium olsonii]|nr:unnamed protein product [Penicillium olsonii]
MLGEGGFGAVWVEKFTSTQGSTKIRAVKMITQLSDARKRSYCDQELEAIAKFSQAKYSHLFVQCLGWFENMNSIYITMEHIELGDLQKNLTNTLPEAEVQRICSQLLQGIQCLHENRLVHRDLKPQNVFVTAKGPKWNVKIGDFGISKKLHEDTDLRTNIGTALYCAPEVLRIYPLGRLSSNLEIYTDRVDIWSLGVMAFHLFTQSHPFLQSIDLTMYVRGSPLPSFTMTRPVTEQGQNFLRRLLTADATKRPSAKQALQDMWFKQSSFDLVSENSKMGISTRLMTRQDSESTTTEVLKAGEDHSRSWSHQETSSVMGEEQTIRPADFSRNQAEAPQSSTSSNQAQTTNPPDLDTFHTEGFSLARQHHYASAEKMFLRAVEIRTRTLGSDHSDTLQSFCYAQLASYVQKEFERAESIWRNTRVLQISTLWYEKTLDSLYVLGKAFVNKKNLVDAETIFRDVWEGQKQTLGEDHQKTRDSLLALRDVLSKT